MLKQKEYFLQGETLSIEFRKKQLIRLKEAVINNEEKIYEALRKDLNKSDFEIYTSEYNYVLKELNNVIKNINSLTKDRKVKRTLETSTGRSYEHLEPLGCVLIISPWNYPFQLTLSPLIGAMAAGNTCIIKPSNEAKHTSLLIEELIHNTFDEEYLKVVHDHSNLFDYKYDLVFFTGSTQIGKYIHSKCSETLTPAILELGGKSPVYVEKTANIDIAVKRICFGKFFNSGQTCIAPDYVMVDEEIFDKFNERLVEEAKKYTMNNMGKMINQKHYDRNLKLTENQEILYQGDVNLDNLQIEPIILLNPDINDEVMKNEIFGPVLPVIKVKNINNVKQMISKNPTPLASYIFSKDEKLQKIFMNEIQSGGGCINDCVLHIANKHLVFGGTGTSGMGSYHGDNVLKSFSNQKSIFKNRNIELPFYNDKERLLKYLKLFNRS